MKYNFNLKECIKYHHHHTNLSFPLYPSVNTYVYARLNQHLKKDIQYKTLEIFKIIRVDNTQSPTIYFLEDLEGESIKGIFYREELIPTTPPESYEIDIIRSKIVAGRKKYLVKRRGYPDKFNSWIDESQITPA